MKQFVAGAMVTTVLGLVAMTMWQGAHAQAAPQAFTQCAVLQTAYAATTDEMAAVKDEGKLPPGWTPVGGGAVPKGMKYVGVVTICR